MVPMGQTINDYCKAGMLVYSGCSPQCLRRMRCLCLTCLEHHIPLHVEFDEHNKLNIKYIVAVGNYLPVATCRLYNIDTEHETLGRIFVLPE